MQPTNSCATGVQAYCGQILHFTDDPKESGEQAFQHFANGMLIVENGRVKTVGCCETLRPTLPKDAKIHTFNHHLIIPGLIDTHTHYPQTEIIGAYGEQLLNWLNKYTYPAEAKFESLDYARVVSKLFISELLRNGTTTALVFGTVHSGSVEALFESAKKQQMRIIAGKVLMDQNAPEELCEPAQQGYDRSKALITKWHGVDRLAYAITPRFAPSCSDHLLHQAGALLKEHPSVYLQTHIAENLAETEWVKALFPSAKCYLDVYDDAGLLGPKSIFAHGVTLSDSELARMAAAESSISHCPSANLFLGSGLFSFQKAQQQGVAVGLGTDIGAGTSFSLFRTMANAYQIQQLTGYQGDPLELLYTATLGAARLLKVDTSIGNFEKGKEADFVVLDLEASPLLSFRLKHCNSIQELVFALFNLGDDRIVHRTYILGRCAYRSEQSNQYESKVEHS